MVTETRAGDKARFVADASNHYDARFVSPEKDQ